MLLANLDTLSTTKRLSKYQGLRVWREGAGGPELREHRLRAPDLLLG
jgi:hypothetical protein